jgi:hypothetical protein
VKLSTKAFKELRGFFYHLNFLKELFTRDKDKGKKGRSYDVTATMRQSRIIPIFTDVQ